jgi:hypothetical protein
MLDCGRLDESHQSSHGFRLRAISTNCDAIHQRGSGHDVLDGSCVVIGGDWLWIDG